MEKELKERIDRIGSRIDAALVQRQTKSSTKAKASSTSEKQPSTFPKPIFCQHLPSASQTNGIEPFYVRLCAQVSTDDYSTLSDISEFDNLAEGYHPSEVGLNEPPKAVLYDNHKPFEATNPPFVAVVAGTKLLLAFRGSQTIMDWDRNLGCYVSGSYRWKAVARVVKVYGSYLTMVENTFAVHEDKLLEIIDEHGIDEILLTGHSLAGGAAQVAHVWLTGTMDAAVDPRPNGWKTRASQKDGLAVRCLSFEGPTTIAFAACEDDPELNQKGIEFINTCGAHMCTTVYHMDPVPRIPQDTSFLCDLLENLMTDVETDKERHHWVEHEAIDLVLHKAKGWFLEHGKTFETTYFPICRRFTHIGKILYYPSADAVPATYIDNPHGILVDPETGKPPDLPELSTIRYKASANVPQAVLWDHLILVCGPGLAFVPQVSPTDEK